jgi:hypothetical protein
MSDSCTDSATSARARMCRGSSAGKGHIGGTGELLERPVEPDPVTPNVIVDQGCRCG